MHSVRIIRAPRSFGTLRWSFAFFVTEVFCSVGFWFILLGFFIYVLQLHLEVSLELIAPFDLQSKTFTKK